MNKTDDLREVMILCDEGGDTSREVWEALMRLMDQVGK